MNRTGRLEPTARSAARSYHDSPYCSCCDLLVGLAGLHVSAVEVDRDVVPDGSS